MCKALSVKKFELKRASAAVLVLFPAWLRPALVLVSSGINSTALEGAPALVGIRAIPVLRTRGGRLHSAGRNVRLVDTYHVLVASEIPFHPSAAVRPPEAEAVAADRAHESRITHMGIPRPVP